MPFYGNADLLRDAVESVLAQSCQDWRLTVVDDCDPDRTVGAWVTGLQHPRVAYHRNSERLGVSGNFRRCVELASGPRVTFMGYDDLLDPDYVRVVGDTALSHPEAAAIQPTVRVINEAGEPSGAFTDRVKRWLAPRSAAVETAAGEALAASLMRGNWTYFPSVCWRTDFVRRHPFRADMETVLDFDLLLNLVFEDEYVVLLPQELFSYRRHRHSASSTTARSAVRFEEESLLYDEVTRRSVERGWHRAARAARWHSTSRLHAAALVPVALSRFDGTSARRLGRHVVRRTRG